MENRITESEALKAYNNPKTQVLFKIYFPTFPDYWKECQKINALPDEEFNKEMQKARDKLEIIKEKDNA